MQIAGLWVRSGESGCFEKKIGLLWSHRDHETQFLFLLLKKKNPLAGIMVFWRKFSLRHEHTGKLRAYEERRNERRKGVDFFPVEGVHRYLLSWIISFVISTIAGAEESQAALAFSTVVEGSRDSRIDLNISNMIPDEVSGVSPTRYHRAKK